MNSFHLKLFMSKMVLLNEEVKTDLYLFVNDIKFSITGFIQADDDESSKLGKFLGAFLCRRDS